MGLILGWRSQKSLRLTLTCTIWDDVMKYEAFIVMGFYMPYDDVCTLHRYPAIILICIHSSLSGTLSKEDILA